MLGLSNSLLGVIQRRNAMDRLIVYAGMLLVTGIIVYVWWLR